MADNFCPYLGSVSDPMSCTTHASEDNLCYATGQGEAVSIAHQKKYCLGGKLTTCPRFPAEPTLVAIGLPVAAQDMEELEVEEDLVAFQDGEEFEGDDVAAFESLEEDNVLEDELEPEREPPFADEPLPESPIPTAARVDGSTTIIGKAASSPEDFYFENVRPEPLGSTSNLPFATLPESSPQMAGRTIEMPPTNQRDISARASQSTLTGGTIPFDDEGLAPPTRTNASTMFGPGAHQPASNVTEQMRSLSDFDESPSDSVYDPTVILPEIRMAQPAPERMPRSGPGSSMGLPEPPRPSPPKGAAASGAANLPRRPAGVDPNWLARHTASQAALNQKNTASSQRMGRPPAGVAPESVLTPTPIYGPVRPFSRHRSSGERQPRDGSAAASTRSNAYLYLSILSTLFAVLLICGGSFLIFRSLSAGEQDIARPMGSVSGEKLVFSTLPTTFSEDSSVPTPASVPGAEPTLTVSLADTATATAEPMATDTPALTSTASSTPTKIPTATEPPTATPTDTATATAAPTETASATAVPMETWTAIALTLDSVLSSAELASPQAAVLAAASTGEPSLPDVSATGQPPTANQQRPKSQHRWSR